MLMPLHHFCYFNFNTCETIYNGFVLIKTCKYYTLLSKCILLLLIILRLSIFDIYQDAYFNLSSLFIKFLHMFVLPDVGSACIAGVELIEGVLSVTHFSSEFTETLKIILSYKSYFAFFMTYNIYILNVIIYIHIC